jgi:MFS family permease
MGTTLESGWPAALRSLRHRDFRILWSGLIVSAVGTWMQIVAQSLLVLQLAHNSAFALGLVSLAQALSFFVFALAGGGFADRLDRKRLLLTTQSVLMGFALLIRRRDAG